MSTKHFENWEVNLIVSISIILSILTNIYYILILIIYIKQGCDISMRKGVSILMAISLIVLNIRFYFPGYDLIEERKVLLLLLLYFVF